MDDVFDTNGTITIRSKLNSLDGSSKYILTLSDGCEIESVYIPQGDADVKLCISNQVGCVNKCAYCATGSKRYVRDLTANEIVSQIICLVDDNNTTLSDMGVLFMGMGEPFFNYFNVTQSIKMLTSPGEAYSCNLDSIVVSTSGVVPKIIDFASESSRARLAISLNASNELLRSSLMPINKVFSLKELLNACDHFIDKTGDRLIFEYVLIKGINDSELDLAGLKGIARNYPCEVQLIPYNESRYSLFEKPNPSTVQMFLNELNDSGIHATAKPSYGIDVLGGCGQLGGD